MKAMYLLIASLIMMSLASCTSNENDPVEEDASTYVLINTYGARSVSESEVLPNKVNLNDLPAMSVAEANTILAGIRKHEASVKDGNVYEAKTNGTSHLKIIMNETISSKYTFTIQLNMTKGENTPICYSGYNANCSSSEFKWYIKGFSLSCDNNNVGNYKFESETYLYFKIIENGVQYMQVPVKVKGTYSPSTQNADFTYYL